MGSRVQVRVGPVETCVCVWGVPRGGGNSHLATSILRELGSRSNATRSWDWLLENCSLKSMEET